MAKYKVIKSFRGSRTGAIVEDFEKDDVVSLDGDLEKIAVEEEWVKKEKESAVSIEIDDDRMAVLVDVINELEEGNEAHWTSSGKPEVKALSELTGTKVTGAERDAAWKESQAE